MKKFALLTTIFVGILSCSEANSGLVKAHNPSQGSDNFRSLLAQGSGRVRPLTLKANTSLGLDAGVIVSTTLDEASGVWSRAIFDTRRSDSLTVDQDLLAFGLEILGRYSDKLGFPPSEANAGTIYEPQPNLKMVTYQRQFNGLPVRGAFVRLLFALGGDGSLHLSEITNNSYGPISIGAALSNQPSESDAIAATGINELQVLAKKAVIQPSMGLNGRYEFAYASEFKLKSAKDSETYTVTMDHDSRELREAYSNRVNEQQSISAETFQRSYVLNDQTFKPLPFAEVIDGTNKLITDASGAVDVENDKVTINLASSKSASSVVDIQQSSSRPATFNVTLDPSGKSVIKLGSVNPAAINVFIAVQRVVDFVGRFIGVDELPLLSSGIVAVVNRKEDVCNAFYDSDSINFFAEGTGPGGKVCANTGLISDVVYHEWGHALDDNLGPNNRSKGESGITDSAYSEGIGDILSTYLTRAPNLGTGLFLNDKKELRNLQNTKKHPPANAAEAEIHEAGTIVGGAFWDMFTSLSALYGNDQGADLATKLFIRHLQISERYLDAYAAVLQVDDDDANPATQSPNYCKITRAFSAHNISGGVFADGDCVDPDVSLNVRVDVDSGDGKLSLLASAFGATKIVACPGQVKTCTATTSGYIEMGAIIGKDDSVALASGRKYYTAKGTVDIKTNPSYSFFSVDPQDVILGARTLRFTSRAK